MPESRYTFAQLVDIASQAGFSHANADIAAAIALAESSGNPDAHNSEGNTPPSTDRGLWQINSYWHPEVSDDCAFSPSCAAREVYRISDGGTSWDAWVTYKTGAYKQYLSGSDSASPGGSQSTRQGSGLLAGKQTDQWGIGQAIANSVGGTGSVLGGIGRNVMNSGTLLVGLLIIAAGVGLLSWMFLNNTQTGQTIKKVGKDVALAVPK